MSSSCVRPLWFQQVLGAADRVRDVVGVVLVANVKGVTTPIDDYETDSIATEFLSTQELDDFIQGFAEAGIFCEVVLNEEGFIEWLQERRATFGRRQPLVYNVTQNGTGAARFSLVPGLCRLNQLPLVDSDAYTVALGQHKFHFISLLEQFGIPVAKSWWFTRHGWWPERPPTGLRIIAKPTLDSASVGIHKANIMLVDGSLEERVRVLMTRFRQPITIQEFVPGYEIEVPVLEDERPRALMAVGIEVGGQHFLGDTILSYEDVFSNDYRFYDFALEDRADANSILDLACRAHMGLGFAGTSRIDFRVSPSGEVKVMEVTCKPHLTLHTSFMHAVRTMGFNHSDLLKFLVGAASLRLGFAQSEAQN